MARSKAAPASSVRPSSLRWRPLLQKKMAACGTSFRVTPRTKPIPTWRYSPFPHTESRPGTRKGGPHAGFLRQLHLHQGRRATRNRCHCAYGAHEAGLQRLDDPFGNLSFQGLRDRCACGTRAIRCPATGHVEKGGVDDGSLSLEQGQS